MAEYRLYCLNDAGRFTRVHEIKANNDAEALARARAMKLPTKCELWEGRRKVATLEPQHPRS